MVFDKNRKQIFDDINKLETIDDSVKIDDIKGRLQNLGTVMIEGTNLRDMLNTKLDDLAKEREAKEAREAKENKRSEELKAYEIVDDLDNVKKGTVLFTDKKIKLTFDKDSSYQDIHNLDNILELGSFSSYKDSKLYTNLNGKNKETLVSDTNYSEREEHLNEQGVSQTGTLLKIDIYKQKSKGGKRRNTRRRNRKSKKTRKSRKNRKKSKRTSRR